MAPPRPAEWLRSTAPSVQAPKCTDEYFLMPMMSLKLTFSNTCTEASAISSLHRNSRSGVPVPHSTTLLSEMPYFASTFSMSSCDAEPLTPSTGRMSKSRLMASQLPSWMSFARYTLRIMAGMTCEFSRWKLSFGPYRFVGMTAM